MTTVTVRVEQRHIDAGVCENPYGCAVALAMMTAGLDRPTVNNALEFTWQGGRYSVPMPKNVAIFVAEHDCAKAPGVAPILKLEPFEFDLIFGPQHWYRRA